MEKENLNVSIRLIPTISEENNQTKFLLQEPNRLINQKTQEALQFSSVIGENQTITDYYCTNLKEGLKTSLTKGFNLTFMNFGLSNLTRSNTIKGNNTEGQDGLYSLFLNDIFAFFNQEKDFKFDLKISIFDIFNENISDYLEIKRPNLEIRENERKIQIDNLTEIPVTTIEKGLSLLKQTDKSFRQLFDLRASFLSGNESFTKYSSTFYKFNLEVSRKSDKKQGYSTQIILVDLPSSDLANPLKKYESNKKNLVRSIQAFYSVIQKLAMKQKAVFTFRESKLTRLLQGSFHSNNTKIYLLSFISQENESECTNILNFTQKFQTISNSKKIVEGGNVFEDKSKFMNENNKLKNKIKELENLMSSKEGPNQNQLNTSVSAKKSESVEKKTELLTTLEKEVTFLKKILLSGSNNISNLNTSINLNNSMNLNESYPGDEGFLEEINENNNGNIFDNSFQILNNSTSKNKQKSIFDSNTKIPESARKLNQQSESFNYNLLNTPNVNRRCFTESKVYSNGKFPGNNLMNRFQIPQSVNFSNFKPLNHWNSGNLFDNETPDFEMKDSRQENENLNIDFLSQNTLSSRKNLNDQEIPASDLVKENESLKKFVNEVKRQYFEACREKDIKIRNLQMNCEKVIFETEENYSNLKIQYDRAKEELKKKELEITHYIQKLRNAEANNNVISKRIHFPDENFEIQSKLEEVSNKYEKINNLYIEEISKNNEINNLNEKLSNELNQLKSSFELINSQLISIKAEKELYVRTNEAKANDTDKLKTDIISYKNEISLHKDKINQLKIEGSKMKNQFEKQNNEFNKLKSDYEMVVKLNSKLSSECSKCTERESKLKEQELEIKSIKNILQSQKEKLNLIEKENSNIQEYEKIIEDSFSKLKELENSLLICTEKNRYLEGLLQKVEFRGGKETEDDEYHSKRSKKKSSTSSSGRGFNKLISSSLVTPFDSDSERLEMSADTANLDISLLKKKRSLKESQKIFEISKAKI